MGWYIPEAHLQPCQASMIESFAQIVNKFQQLTIFTKTLRQYVSQDSKYASAVHSSLNKITNFATFFRMQCITNFLQLGNKYFFSVKLQLKDISNDL